MDVIQSEMAYIHLAIKPKQSRLWIISDDAMFCVLIGCAPNTRSFFMYMYSFFIGYATLDEPFDWMYLP